MDDQKKKIILSKPEDWDTWINLVRIKAETDEVWNLIDPDLSSKPVALTKPNKLPSIICSFPFLLFILTPCSVSFLPAARYPFLWRPAREMGCGARLVG